MKHGFSFLIRILTVAPILAALTVTALAVWRYGIFGGPLSLVLSYVFLTVLPLLAYPLQRFFPHFRDGGRPAQRMLAIIFAFAGYVACVVSGLILGVGDGLWVLYLEYLFCGAVMLVFNKLFRLHISGHACGVVGPLIIFLRFRLFVPAAVAALLCVAVAIASLRTKRHTPLQLLGGALVPCAGMLLLFLLFPGPLF